MVSRKTQQVEITEKAWECAKERLEWYVSKDYLEIWRSVFFDIDLVFKDASKRKK